MRFRLLFEGDLRPKGSANVDHIHAIRRHLHPQIKRLWDHQPLAKYKQTWLRVPDAEDHKVESVYQRFTTVAGRAFYPLLNDYLAAELHIVFLRQQAPGQLIGEGGDIDNRLKTLFDALRLPNIQEVQQLNEPNDSEPIHCLLKDDSLIHRVDVETDRLLRDADARHILAIIDVSVIVTKVTLETLSLSGG